MASPAFSDTQRQQVERLLAARGTIAAVPFCWVITAADGGGANARIVKAQPSADGEDFWTRWFLTPRIGRNRRKLETRGG